MHCLYFFLELKKKDQFKQEKTAKFSNVLCQSLLFIYYPPALNSMCIWIYVLPKFLLAFVF